MEKNLIIIGAGGHCRSVLDGVKSNDREILIFDEFLNAETFCGFPLIHGLPEIEQHPSADWSIHVAIGNNQKRQDLCETYSRLGYSLETLCHRGAIVSVNATVSDGCAILPGAVVNAGAHVGCGAIINTKAIVEHDCKIGAFAHLSTGAITTGGCQVGARSWIGAGAVLRQGTNIGDDVIIGAGALVLKDIHKEGTYVGAPVYPLEKLSIVEPKDQS